MANQLNVAIYEKSANATSTLVGLEDHRLLNCWIKKQKEMN